VARIGRRGNLKNPGNSHGRAATKNRELSAEIERGTV
jgi:hypothetical protein